MKKITFLLALLLITSLSYGQAMSGTYNVGTGEVAPNFTSLKAAADALNANGISGDVVLEITSNLTETESSRIGVITGTNSITIRPSSDTDYRIELKKSLDNSRASGLIIVGLTADNWDNLTDGTNNIIVDGYAVGGSTRRLTLATTDATNIFHGPIQIVGKNTGVVVKNCILDQRNIISGQSTTYAVRIRIEKNTAGTIFEPSNVTIENNVITAVKNTAQIGIGLTAASGITTNTIAGVIIKNNEINARTRGISMSNNSDITIEGNIFKTEQVSPGMLSTWIQGIANGGGDINIKGNKFISALTANTNTGGYGIRGIIASGGGTWYIDNNFFTGFKVTGTTGVTDMIAIRCGNTCIIRNNTFYLNSLSASGIVPVYQGILIAAGTPTIMNNIMLSDEDAIANTLITGTVGGSSDYNNLYLKAGNTNARINSIYTNLADYQSGTGKDANSTSVDVQFENAATGDLRIAGTSQQDINLSAPLISAVSTDILGAVRQDPTYKGAHQGILPFVATGVGKQEVAAYHVRSTATGVEVIFEGEATIELYTINGVLINKTNTFNNYSYDLNKGAYIIRVNGKATKFVR